MGAFAVFIKLSSLGAPLSSRLAGLESSSGKKEKATRGYVAMYWNRSPPTFPIRRAYNGVWSPQQSSFFCW